VVRLVDQVEEGLAVGAAEGEEFLRGGGGLVRRGKGEGERGRGEGKGAGGREDTRKAIGEGRAYRVSLDVRANHAGAQVAGLVRGDEVGGEGRHG